MREPYERERDEREAYTTRRPRAERELAPEPEAKPEDGERKWRLSPKSLVPLGPLVKRLAELVKPEPEE